MKRFYFLVSIFTFCLFLSANPALKAQTTADSTTIWHIETLDGNDFIGTIVWEDSEAVRLKTKNIGEITVPRKSIKRLERLTGNEVVNDVYWFENPHATRYFWGPNGYGLRKGEHYYQNIWVLFNQVSFGITDNFTLGIGTMPVFLFGAGVVPMWITPKFSIPITPNKFNIGLGALYARAFGEDADDGGVGLLYGATTFGGRDKNITLGLGYGFADGELATSPTISLSGMTRVGKKAYLITENYFISTGYENFAIISAGGRWVGKSIAIDYGLFRPLTEDFSDFIFAFPWLGITVPFGKKVRGEGI